MPKNIQMIPCDSSFISAFGYDQEDEVLRVRFKKDGAEVEYTPVSPDTFAQMQNDPRPGQFFRQRIYNQGYQWSRV